jgi:hypothetical protein
MRGVTETETLPIPALKQGKYAARPLTVGAPMEKVENPPIDLHMRAFKFYSSLKMMLHPASGV